MVEIAQGRGGDEDGHQEDAQHREHAEQPHDDHRRIAQHIAAGAANDHRIGAGQGEGQRAEYRRDDPEQRRLQLLAQFKAKYLEKHG